MARLRAAQKAKTAPAKLKQRAKKPNTHHNHADENKLGNQCAAFDFVRDPAAEWAGQSTNQRAEEGIFYRINPGKLTLDQQGEACGKTDEGAESAQIKDAHNPVMLAAENHGLVFEAGFGGSQIVHAKPSG